MIKCNFEQNLQQCLLKLIRMENQSVLSDSIEYGRWNEEEQTRFVYSLMKYGKDWKRVQEIVMTRNGSQVRSHAQKFFQKIIRMTKQRKKLNKKGKVPENQTQDEFLKLFKKELISENTPQEIVSLLRVFSVTGTENKQYEQNSIKGKKTYETLEKKQLNEVEQKKGVEIISNIESHNYSDEHINQSNYKKRQQKMEHGIQEEQSYFMYFLRGNIDHLSTNYNFSQFIDFGKTTTHIPKEPRKRSFQIPNQQYDEEKLQKTLKGLREYTKNQHIQ